MPHLRKLSLSFCMHINWYGSGSHVPDLRDCYQLECLKLNHCGLCFGQRLPNSLKRLHSIHSDDSYFSLPVAGTRVLDDLEEIMIRSDYLWSHKFRDHWLSEVAIDYKHAPERTFYPSARHSIKRLTIIAPQFIREIDTRGSGTGHVAQTVSFERILEFRCRELESFHYSATGSSQGLPSLLNKYCPNLRHVHLGGLDDLDPASLQRFMTRRAPILRTVTLNSVKLHVRTEEDTIDACNMLARTARQCGVTLNLVNIGYCGHADEYWYEMSDSETD